MENKVSKVPFYVIILGKIFVHNVPFGVYFVIKQVPFTDTKPLF